MSYLPIVQRELIVAARRKWTFRVRMGSAFVACGLGALLVLMTMSSRSSGRPVFTTLTTLGFIFACFAGVFVTSDCISQERREGTLGFLFLTDLRGFDVVLGKFAALFIPSLFGLLATVPVLAMSMLLGGVTNGEFWRTVLALLSTLFLSQAFGVYVSAFQTDERRAIGFSALAVATVAIGMTMVSWLPRSLFLPGICEYLSPWNLMRASGEMGYLMDASSFWIGLAAVNGTGLLALGIASWKLPDIWRTEADRTGEESRRKVIVELSGTAGRRRPALVGNPIRWIAGDRGTVKMIAWILAVCAFLAQLAVLGPRSVAGAFGLVWPFWVIMEILIALEATRFFAEARRSGGLELLLATPLSAKEILDGHRAMMLETFRGPVIAMMLARCLSANALFSASADEVAVYFAVIVLSVATIPFQALAICWKGTHLALEMSRPGFAAALALVHAVVIPMVLSVFCFCFPVTLIYCMVLTGRNRTAVQKNFRTLAMPEYWPGGRSPNAPPWPEPVTKSP